MALPRFQFAGGTAVVTGAASGIGEALAHALADRGSHLVLLDRDVDRLVPLADSLRANHVGLTIETVAVDLVDADATALVARQILHDHPQISLLVNNAGVALGGRFDQMTLEEFDWVMDINFRAPVVLTHHLLPALAAQPGSHLVNVSSLFGIIAPAGQSAYSASKFALRGFSEALRSELGEHGVGVTTVHPGGVRTRIAENARVASGVSQEDHDEGKRLFARLLTYPPDKAAELILNGVERRRGRVLISFSAKAPDLIARLFPSSYAPILGWIQSATGTRTHPDPARAAPVRAAGH